MPKGKGKWLVFCFFGRFGLWLLKFHRTVFFVCVYPDCRILQQLFNFWKERSLLIASVCFHELVPRQAVADEARLVNITDVEGLVVDGIVASEDGVVHVTHMAGTSSEHVFLF
jgi:hypothetical protein